MLRHNMDDRLAVALNFEPGVLIGHYEMLAGGGFHCFAAGCKAGKSVVEKSLAFKKTAS